VPPPVSLLLNRLTDGACCDVLRPIETTLVAVCAQPDLGLRAQTAFTFADQNGSEATDFEGTLESRAIESVASLPF
jgi:hypothetical protein